MGELRVSWLGTPALGCVIGGRVGCPWAKTGAEDGRDRAVEGALDDVDADGVGWVAVLVDADVGVIGLVELEVPSRPG